MFISLLTNDTKIHLSAKLCKKVVGSEMRFYSKMSIVQIFGKRDFTYLCPQTCTISIFQIDLLNLTT